MFTLDTSLFTPEGFVEAWELFPGFELLDSNNERYEIEETIETEEEVSLLILDDESEVKVATRFIEKNDIKIGDDLINNKPIRFMSIEEEGFNVEIVERSEGVEYGTFGKYDFIPHRYLTGFIHNRKMFFNGLLFSHLLERYTDDNRVFFRVKTNEFAEDMLYLVRSLGGTGFYHLFYDDASFYEVEIQLPDYFEEGTPSRKITDIESLGNEEVIEFVTKQDNFIVNDFICLTKR